MPSIRQYGIMKKNVGCFADLVLVSESISKSAADGNFIKTVVELTGFEIFKISAQIEENAENLCDHAA